MRPLLLGHRGLRLAGAPAENTFAAFDAALDAGADGFEFDVRLTADGIPAICHDPEHEKRVIADCTWAELALPQLGDVVSRYAARAFLNIELKVPGLEGKTVDAVTQHGADNNRLLISSFLPEVLQDLHSLDSGIPLGFLLDQPSALGRWHDLPVHSVVPNHRLVTPELVRDVHSAGKSLFTWTVNRPENMTRLAQWGVDAIISDNPKLLVDTLRL